jgi:hypothetical protein
MTNMTTRPSHAMLLSFILFWTFLLHSAAGGWAEALVKNQQNQQCILDMQSNKVGSNVYIYLSMPRTKQSEMDLGLQHRRNQECGQRPPLSRL